MAGYGTPSLPVALPTCNRRQRAAGVSDYMKTTSRLIKVTLATLAVAFVLTGTSNLWADDGCYAPSPYRHDHYGYWDGHGHYRHFAYYHDHRGYWDYRGPVRVFISVG